MKITELRELTIEELQQKLEDSREELFNLRFQKAMNRLVVQLETSFPQAPVVTQRQ